MNICEATKAKFCFFSSSEIYGNPPIEEMPIREEYGNVSSTPALVMMRVNVWRNSVFDLFKESNVHTNIIRPFNVYGPGMQSTDFRVMPNFALSRKMSLCKYMVLEIKLEHIVISDAIAGFVKILRG